jgi:type I restriction enzyme R subunit
VRSFIAESGVEEVCLEYFADLGWLVLHGPDIAPNEPAAERSSYRDVLLEGRLRSAISWLNPELPSEAVDQVVATVRRPESADVLAENWRVHRLLTQGVPVEIRDEGGELRHELAWLVDFDQPERNDFVVVNQMSVEQDDKTRRPRAPAFSRFVPLVQSPHMTHEREATLVGQVKEPERRVNRTGHLVHFGRTPGPCL